MIYLLYWIGILILGFAIMTLAKVSNAEDEDLPIDKDNLIRVVLFLTIIGYTFIAVSKPFINYINEELKNKPIFKLEL